MPGDRRGVEAAHAERRMGDGSDRFAEQALGARRGARCRAITNRDVSGSSPQIDDLVVRRHPDVDIRMALLEAAEARHDPQTGDADTGGDRDRLAVPACGKRGDAVLELLERAVGDPKETLALGGEADRAITAV